MIKNNWPQTHTDNLFEENYRLCISEWVCKLSFVTRHSIETLNYYQGTKTEVR